MEFDFREVDAGNLDEFDSFYSVYRAATSNEISSPYTRREIQGRLNATSNYMRHLGFELKKSDQPVAVAYLEIPLKDNLDKVYLLAYTHPQLRNRGYGSLLLEKVEEYIFGIGRKTIVAGTNWSASGEHREGVSFLENRGYKLGSADEMRALQLPWQQKDPKTNENYRLLTWRHSVPDEWVDEYARLRALLFTEAPTGEVGYENEYWDATRIRTEEKELTAYGRTMSTTVAVAADGTLAGHTQLVFDEGEDLVYQWDTLVLREHRGKGLGYSMKVQNMNETKDLLAGRRQLRTWNAGVNAHMIAINEAMGFRHIANLGEYLKKLA